MKITPLAIKGSWLISSPQHRDRRGMLQEWYRHDHLTEAVGSPPHFAQANVTVSALDVIRGVHFADTPPGQAKYVTCPRGAILDVVVDVRVGSPTFGRWESVRLDERDRRAVYLAEGLGHAFCALADDTIVTFLCSTTYDPAVEHRVHPLDPGLSIAWPTNSPVLSPKDAAAPTLAEARSAGVLPRYTAAVR